MILYILVVFNDDETISGWHVKSSLRDIIHSLDSGYYKNYKLFCLDFRETRMSIEEMKV